MANFLKMRAVVLLLAVSFLVWGAAGCSRDSSSSTGANVESSGEESSSSIKGDLSSSSVKGDRSSSSAKSSSSSTVKQSNDASLKSLKVTDRSAKPYRTLSSERSSSDTTAYTVLVLSKTTAVRIEGIASHANATVSPTDTTLTLEMGIQAYPIFVTAENGETQIYTVTIVRENAELSELFMKKKVAKGQDLELPLDLFPSFHKDSLAYDVTLPTSLPATEFRVWASAASGDAILSTVWSFSGKTPRLDPQTGDVGVFPPGYDTVIEITVTTPNNQTQIYRIRGSRPPV